MTEGFTLALTEGFTPADTKLQDMVCTPVGWQSIGEHLMQMQMFSYGLKSHEKRKK